MQPKSFNLNLNGILNCGVDCAKENKYKKIYLMTDTLYNQYKNAGLIITKNDKEFYRLFTEDEWLIQKMS